MSLKNLKQLKKIVVTEKIERYVRHLVVGQDIFAVLAYKNLVASFGKDEVLLLTSKEILFSDLFPMGPTTLRGEKNITAFSASFSSAMGKAQSEPTYYKDQKFRPFSGRGKPEELLWGEEFFTQVGHEIKWPLLSGLSDSNETRELLSETLIANIKTIKRATSSDLINRTNYEVILTDGSILRSEYLIWCEAPHRFLFYYDEKSTLSSSVVAFCDQSVTKASLFVTFVVPRKIADADTTIFIPQSYTHPWGHFIGEVKELSEGGQRLEFRIFVDLEMMSEDEISKKMRNLKRSLEKIYPDFKIGEAQEFIFLQEESPPLGFTTEQFPFEENPFLDFVGAASPLHKNHEVTHHCRAFLSVMEVKEKFSK